MQARRELIRFLSDYQELWHAQFPDLYRRGQWHMTCHLCLRGGRGGVPVAELAGVVKSLFLLDDATVRERVQDIQALGLCEIDPPDRTLSARTIVIPTDTLLARFDEHLLALAARLRETARVVDPGIRRRATLVLDQATRQAILGAVERCDQVWIAALEAVFDRLKLSPARRLDARRHLLSLSHRMLLLMGLEHAYGVSPHADEGDGLLADHMAALLLRLGRQNFQTTRDHIGYLLQIGLMERQAGRALRVALAPSVTAAFDPELTALAASLPALVRAFDGADDVEATLTLRQPVPALMPVAVAARTLIVSRAGEPPREVAIGTEPMIVGRAPGGDVVLPADEVSRMHCRLVPGEAGLTVIDLQSTNGTFLDGQRVATPTAMLPNSELRIGPFILTCRVDVTIAAGDPAARGAATHGGASPGGATPGSGILGRRRGAG